MSVGGSPYHARMAKTASRAVAAGSALPMIVIAGEELFLRTEHLAHVQKQIFGGDDPGMGLVRLDPGTAGEDVMASILDEVRTPSMFAPKKMVVVDPADALFKKEAESQDPRRLGNREILESYLEKPVEGSTLVLVVT